MNGAETRSVWRKLVVAESRPAGMAAANSQSAWRRTVGLGVTARRPAATARDIEPEPEPTAEPGTCARLPTASAPIPVVNAIRPTANSVRCIESGALGSTRNG